MLRRQVHDDRPGPKEVDHIAGDEERSFLPEHLGSRNHDIDLRQARADGLHFLLDEFGRELLGVAAGRFGILGQFHLDEHRAQALHLVAHRRAGVKRLDARPESLGRGDRLQAGHTRAENQYGGRGDRAGGGHEQRKHLAEAFGGDEDGLVAGDGRLRTKGIHALRTSDARDELHRIGGDAALDQHAQHRNVAERSQAADVNSALADRARFRHTRRLDLEHEVGLGAELAGGGDDFRAGGSVLLIARARARARAGLDQDLMLVAQELAGQRRDEGDPRLASGGFFENSYLHGRWGSYLKQCA